MSKEVDESTRPKLDKKGTKTLIALMTNSTRVKAYESLGISKEALYKRIRKYKLNDYLDEIPQEALSTLKQGSIAAAENFVSKIDSRNENVSMEASKEILDRVGVVKPSNTTNNVQVNVQPILQIDPNVHTDNSDNENNQA